MNMSMRSVWRSSPLLKTVLPGTLAIGVGDYIEQKVEGKEEWCPDRTARMAITGMLLVTPIAHYVGASLDRAFPSSSTFSILSKAGLNAAATIFFIVGSFSGNNFLSGRNLEALRLQLKERLFPTYMAGLWYWSAANLLLFRYFPKYRRGGMVASVAAHTLWSVHLSKQLNKSALPAKASAISSPLAVNDFDRKMEKRAINNFKLRSLKYN